LVTKKKAANRKKVARQESTSKNIGKITKGKRAGKIGQHTPNKKSG